MGKQPFGRTIFLGMGLFVAVAIAIQSCFSQNNLPVATTNIRPLQTTPPQVLAADPAFQNEDIFSFVLEAFSSAQALYGPPQIKVNRIYLKSTDSYSRASLDDATAGDFSIYLSRQPTEYAFEGLLAHEVHHMLNARLLDCREEGLATLFASQFVVSKGGNWSRWDTYFQDGNDAMYGTAYSLMKSLLGTIGPGALNTLLRYAVQTGNSQWMHLDLDAWLSDLPDEVSTKARQVFDAYRTDMQTALQQDSYLHNKYKAGCF